jgi:hypothetical protein
MRVIGVISFGYERVVEKGGFARDYFCLPDRAAMRGGYRLGFRNTVGWDQASGCQLCTNRCLPKVC